MNLTILLRRGALIVLAVFIIPVSVGQAVHEAGCDLAPPGDRVEHCQKAQGFEAATDVLDQVSTISSSTSTVVG